MYLLFYHRREHPRHADLSGSRIRFRYAFLHEGVGYASLFRVMDSPPHLSPYLRDSRGRFAWDSILIPECHSSCNKIKFISPSRPVMIPCWTEGGSASWEPVTGMTTMSYIYDDAIHNIQHAPDCQIRVYRESFNHSHGSKAETPT